MDTSNLVEPEVETAPVPAAPARPFQFSAASALTSARQESLESWHRNFLRLASASLGDLLRMELNLELASVRIQAFGEIMEERTGENQCVLFRLQPQPGLGLLDLPVSLAHALVERMMGGATKHSIDKTGELTELDQAIFQQFAETLLADYARNWKPHAELRAEVLRQVRNLNFQFIHQPEDLILRVGLKIKLQETESLIWIVVPIVAVEDLLLRSLASNDRIRDDGHAAIKDKKSPVGSVPVPVSIRWQGFQMSLREVEAMNPGDILVLDNKKCEQAVVYLGDRAKFCGKVVRDTHKTTLTITHPLE